MKIYHPWWDRSEWHLDFHSLLTLPLFVLARELRAFILLCFGLEDLCLHCEIWKARHPPASPEYIICLSGNLFPRSTGLFSVGLTCPAPLCPRLLLILFRVYPGHICLHCVYGYDFLTAHPQNDNDLLPHHHRFHPWRHLQSDQKLSGNSLSCFTCVS
jgi:hypothetical protein